MIFFDDWTGVLRIVFSVPIVYFGVIVFIRISGKRSTSQMNNFDWIVTVAMGSIVASAILLENVVLIEGLLGIALLLALQYGVTKLSLFSSLVSKLVRAEPTILFYRGEFLENAMRRERVIRDEIIGAIREKGFHNLAQVEAVVLESDAKFSVLPSQDNDTGEISQMVGWVSNSAQLGRRDAS